MARGFAFWVDKILLGLILLPLTGTFPMNEHLHNELLTTAAFGVYRVLCEFCWGRSPGKALMSLRVYYSDAHGQERSGWNRLLFVLLRNSWLLAAGIVWFWSSEAEVGGIAFLLFLSMFFTRDRATLMDILAKARVCDTKISNTRRNAF
ncbi:RDD family protein [Corynebacterium sp. A21]|uniref:RDD family protein n=1 Tax=Corynebacterium sp. A21 TaxID=3457318 RepID=UPI003FD5B6B2